MREAQLVILMSLAMLTTTFLVCPTETRVFILESLEKKDVLLDTVRQSCRM